MATYIEWLYTRQISVEELDKEDPDEPAPDLQSLVEDYVTGIIIDDPDFSTALLEALLETIKNTGIHPSCTAIKIAYEKTSGPCGLRQLLVQTAAAAGGYITYERDDWDNHPSDFIKDLCTAVMKKRKVDDNWDLEAMSKKCKTAEEYKDYDEHQEDTGESEEGTKSENGATE
jgi:hypothetical protein